MSDKEYNTGNNLEDRLLNIENSIIQKIENKTHKLDKKIDKFVEKKMVDKKKFVNKKVPMTHHIKVDKRKDLTPQQQYELKKHKVVGSFKSHLTVFIAVQMFLFVIWIVSGGFAGVFPWFIFPFFGWGIGVAGHFASMKQKLHEYKIIYMRKGVDTDSNISFASLPQNNSGMKKLESDFDSLQEIDADNLNEPYYTYVVETIELSGSLNKQINNSNNVDKELIQEIKTSLKHYTEKIYWLAKRGQFLQVAIEGTGAESTELEKQNIEEKLSDDSLDDSVKKEYENAMRLLDKQLASFSKLKKVKDTTDARLKTSLITLKNLQLDFLRLQYLTDESAEDAIQSLNKKTEEIDEYIDLLSDSLKDIDSQI